jgi:putative PEP-CTERM system histidine kinase
VTVVRFLPFAAGAFSLALAMLLQKRHSAATWCFCAGMTALGLDSMATGLGLQAGERDQGAAWLAVAFVIKSVVPPIWLFFSLIYSRSNYRSVLRRWRVALAVLAIVPIALSVGAHVQVLQGVADGNTVGVSRLQLDSLGRVLDVVFLVEIVLVLMNLEQTFRSTVGTMRWRIKFVVLAMGVILGARLYVRSQVILFTAPAITLWSLEPWALLIGCALLTLAYARTGWDEIDVHPSSAVLRSSLTVLIVGIYLFVVGVLAQLVRRFGGSEFFQLQAMVVLLGLAGLAVLLSSDRARQRLHVFVGRHFTKAQHDSVRLWALLSERLATVTDQAGLSAVSVKLVAEAFDVLSVTIWLLDEDKGRLFARASTAPQAPGGCGDGLENIASPAVTAGIAARTSPFDLEGVREAWAEELRTLNGTTFATGGHRLCVPLRAGERCLGVLADRISGVPYTGEELDLLACIGDQITSVLLNLRLAGEVARARELEAFQTMSAFFVHDLKNAAASLNLTLANLAVHFDDPAFRQDALRGIGNTAGRIDEMIARLSAIRQRPESVRVDFSRCQACW